MEQIAIKKLKVKDNVRVDYGNLDELVRSIKETGVRFPVVVSDKNEIIDGHRRVKAATKAGLEEVPFVISQDKLDKTAEQLIAGMLQKNLTPFEEGKAFENLIKYQWNVKGKDNAEKLAKQIGKSKEYVQRRLLLNKCCSKVKDAVKNREIEVGHASILGQLQEKQQLQGLKAIKNRGLSVADFAEAMAWFKKVDLSNVAEEGDIIKIPQKEKQVTLNNLGQDIRGYTSDIADSAAFRPELKAYIDDQRQKLRAKGMVVFDSEAKLKKKHPAAVQLRSWDSEYQNAARNLSGSQTYAVVVDWNGYSIVKAIYRVKPKPTKKEAAKTPAAQKKVEEELEMTREERLVGKIEEFKTAMLKKSVEKRLKPGDVGTNVLVAYFLSNQVESIKELGDATDRDLKKATCDMIKDDVCRIHSSDLQEAADLVEVDIDADFIMTAEYADMYTKDQLIDLCKEGKIKLPETDLKKSGYVDLVVKQWPKGKAPKQLKKVQL